MVCGATRGCHETTHRGWRGGEHVHSIVKDHRTPRRQQRAHAEPGMSDSYLLYLVSISCLPPPATTITPVNLPVIFAWSRLEGNIRGTAYRGRHLRRARCASLRKAATTTVGVTATTTVRVTATNRDHAWRNRCGLHGGRRKGHLVSQANPAQDRRHETDALHSPQSRSFYHPCSPSCSHHLGSSSSRARPRRRE